MWRRGLFDFWRKLKNRVDFSVIEQSLPSHYKDSAPVSANGIAGAERL